MGNPNNTLPCLLPGPYRSHQPIRSPPPQAQRTKGAQRQLGTQIRDSEEGKFCPGPSQGCPRKGSVPQSRHETYQEESTSEHPWDQGRSLPSTWDTLWGAGEEHSGIAQGLLQDAQGRNQMWGNPDIDMVWGEQTWENRGIRE